MQKSTKDKLIFIILFSVFAVGYVTFMLLALLPKLKAEDRCHKHWKWTEQINSNNRIHYIYEKYMGGCMIEITPGLWMSEDFIKSERPDIIEKIENFTNLTSR